MERFKVEEKLIIKRVNYREPLKNHFEAQKVFNRMALCLNRVCLKTQLFR